MDKWFNWKKYGCIKYTKRGKMPLSQIETEVKNMLKGLGYDLNIKKD